MTYIILGAVAAIIYKLLLSNRKIDYSDKIIWITGASSGIGEHLAYEFSKHGAHILLSGRNFKELERVHQKIPSKSTIIPFDLSDADSTFEKANQVCKNHKIFMLVNNAGISQRALFEESLSGISLERKLMEINYFSAIALTKAFIANLNGRKGQVVVVSSTAGLLGAPLRTGYSAAKSGIIGYYDSLRPELKDLGIDVIHVSPGFVNTNVSKNALDHNGNSFDIEDSYNKNGYQPDDFAKIAVRKIFYSKTHVFIGQPNMWLAYFIKSFSPSLKSWLIKTVFAKSLKKVIRKVVKSKANQFLK